MSTEKGKRSDYSSLVDIVDSVLVMLAKLLGAGLATLVSYHFIWWDGLFGRLNESIDDWSVFMVLPFLIMLQAIIVPANISSCFRLPHRLQNGWNKQEIVKILSRHRVFRTGLSFILLIVLLMLLVPGGLTTLFYSWKVFLATSGVILLWSLLIVLTTSIFSRDTDGRKLEKPKGKMKR